MAASGVMGTTNGKSRPEIMGVIQTSLLIIINIIQVSSDHGGDEFMPSRARHGAWVEPSYGGIWPRPKHQNFSPDFLEVRSKDFGFKIISEDIHGPCDILQQAVNRFPQRVFPPAAANVFSYQRNRTVNKDLGMDPRYKGTLEVVQIKMKNKHGCEKYPYMDMDESYSINVDTSTRKALIQADTVWGSLRGLESFSQLVFSSMEFGKSVKYLVRGTWIQDSPRFTHRGVHIDTSRHYIAKSVIKDNIDLMEMNKYNVLHWHITDEPGSLLT